LGEQLVAKWLQTHNWAILYHRWRCRWGELDLIAYSGDGETQKILDKNSPHPRVSPFVNHLTPPTTPSPVLAFVEVKTRSAGNWDADGRLAITPQKQAKLWQAAQLFLAEYPELAELPCQFDVALVNYQRVSSRPERHKNNLLTSPTAMDNTIPVQSVQLGEPILVAGYQLILQDYIPAAFD
jgi:putative endonuclease